MPSSKTKQEVIFMQLWNTEWNVWMKMSIPPIFCPNPSRTSTDISPIFCPSGHCTALQPGSSWAPLAPEKWLPQWTGKKWWQRSTRDLYLPYFCTKARRARGTGEKDRGRGGRLEQEPKLCRAHTLQVYQKFPRKTSWQHRAPDRESFKKALQKARWACVRVELQE